MARRRRKYDTENNMQLNMTPMIDVIFQLLIFFMCSFHFKKLEGKIESHLPKDKGLFTITTDILVEEVRIKFTYDAGANVVNRTISGRPCNDDAELEKILRSQHESFKSIGKTRVPVILDADKDVPFGPVVTVLNICHKAKIPNVEFTAPLEAAEMARRIQAMGGGK